MGHLIFQNSRNCQVESRPQTWNQNKGSFLISYRRSRHAFIKMIFMPILMKEGFGNYGKIMNGTMTPFSIVCPVYLQYKVTAPHQEPNENLSVKI